MDRRRFRFRIHQPRGGRIVAVRVYINGERMLKRRVRSSRRRITSVSIKRPPLGRFRVKIVAVSNTGTRTISTRTYTECDKSRPKTRVKRPKKGRRRGR